MPRIAVTVGCDHHPFDRLMGWINNWLDGHPERATAFFVQSGPAVLVPACQGSDFLGTAELSALLDSADIMVCHGGPGSIADAWQRARVPIVVPRLRAHGEVVDDHQVEFCRVLAGQGRVLLAEDATTFAGLLDEAFADPARFCADAAGADLEFVVGRFGQLVDDLVSRGGRRRRPARQQKRDARGRGGRRRAPTTTVPVSLAAAKKLWPESHTSAQAELSEAATQEQQ